MTIKILDELLHPDFLQRLEYANKVEKADMLKRLHDEIQSEMDAKHESKYRMPVKRKIRNWCEHHKCGLDDYINHFYLPRPLDSEGNPIEKDHKYVVINPTHESEIVRVNDICGIISYEDAGGRYLSQVVYDTKFGKQFLPIGSESLELIQAEAALDPAYYCGLYEIELSDNPDADECRIKATNHLLSRQRKLMEGEA